LGWGSKKKEASIGQDSEKPFFCSNSSKYLLVEKKTRGRQVGRDCQTGEFSAQKKKKKPKKLGEKGLGRTDHSTYVPSLGFASRRAITTTKHKKNKAGEIPRASQENLHATTARS